MFSKSRNDRRRRIGDRRLPRGLRQRRRDPGLEKVLISPWLVTLLHICRSYTNSAIAGNSAPISSVTVPPRNRRRRRAERRRLRIQRRRLHIERRYRRIEWPPHDRRRRRPKRRRLHIERRYRRIEWRLFLDVSQCFKCFVMFYWWFTMFYKCFMMFYNVLWCLASRARRNDRRRRIGARTAIDRDNSAEIGDGAAGIVYIAANVIPC